LGKNKSPYFIDWVITEKCNLNCRHCRGMTQGELSSQRAHRLIDEIAILQPDWVIIEGGEPLLRPDLFELLNLLRDRQIEVHLITNGMLITPQIINTLKPMGVRVMISVDGATPKTYETIRQGADFSKVLQSVTTCASEGILEAINFTLLKNNYTEISDIFKLAHNAGVPKINVIGLKPCYNYPEELLTPEEYKEVITRTCQAAGETGVEFFFDEPFFWATVKELGIKAPTPSGNAGILATATTACAFGEYLFVEPNGEVKPCSFAQMVVGNVNQETLNEIWDKTLASPLIQQIKEPQSRTGYCRDCPYLADCKGCRARTFALTGDWFADDPACPLRHRPAIKETK